MIALNLAYNKNKLSKTLEYYSYIRSLLIFQKRVWDQFFQEKCFSCYILLTGQISLSYCLYVSRYWTIYVLQLYVLQLLTIYVLTRLWRHKTWNLSRRFATWPKSQDKNLNILRTKRAYELKLKVIFIIFNGFSVAKICLRPESMSLRLKPIALSHDTYSWYNDICIDANYGCKSDLLCIYSFII